MRTASDPDSFPSRRVGIVLADNVLSTSATLPYEMMATAAATARALGAREPRLELRYLSVDGAPVTSASGLVLAADCALAESGCLDLVHLPGQWRNPRRAVRAAAARLSPWLRDQYRAGAILTAVGTGVCFVAESGLLDGKAATTHWHWFDAFQRDYPQVQLKRQYFITQAGNLYCAASVNALAELMVHIIYLWYGRAVANNVERNFFHEIRGEFEPRRYLAGQVEHLPDEVILQAKIWLEDNFARRLSVPALAAQFGMSRRTFDRRFRQALGTTPAAYLRQLRLRHARELLKASDLTVAEVAELCGFQDAAHLARAFAAQYRVTPGKYRETVRGKLFSRAGAVKPGAGRVPSPGSTASSGAKPPGA